MPLQLIYNGSCQTTGKMPFAEVKLISIFNITSKYLILYPLRNVTIVVTVTLLLFVTLICYVNLLEMKLSTTECVQCKKTFEPKNKRNIYCSDGCKQEAYRIRNNIETPNFLKTQEEKFHVFKSENKTIVYRDVYTKEYTDKRKKIRELNIQLSRLIKEEKATEEKVQKIITRNDSFWTKKVAGIITFITTVIAGWAIYGLIKGFMKFKLTKWGLFILIAPFIILAVLISISIQKSSDKLHEDELSNLGKYKSNLETLKSSIKAIEDDIKNEEQLLLSINQFERIGEEKITEVIEKIKQPKGGFPTIKENDAKEIMSLSDLQSVSFKTLGFTGEWNELMGTPEESFSVMIYGQSGHGKSTFAISFAEYLANNFGPVLFNSAEEGISLTLQDKLKNLRSDDLFISHHKDFHSIKKYLKRSDCKFIILDSVNHMNLTPDNIEELRKMNKTRGFISIHQVTKSGDFKGNNQFLHNCDVEIIVENYKPIIKKSRYKVRA